MPGSGARRPSPASVVASLGVVAALAGTAVAANPVAETGAKKVTKKKVKRIAAKQANKRITKRAPSLSVAHAETAASAEAAGDASSLGGLPPAAFERAGRIAAGSVAVTDPVGTRVLLDQATGADVRLGPDAGKVRIINTSTSRPMTAVGISTFGDNNSFETEFASLGPGEQEQFGFQTLGARYLDLLITLAAPNAPAARRARLTCGVAGGSGQVETVLSCIAVR